MRLYCPLSNSALYLSAQYHNNNNSTHTQYYAIGTCVVINIDVNQTSQCIHMFCCIYTYGKIANSLLHGPACACDTYMLAKG